MQSESSFLCSYQHATETRSEPVDSSPHRYTPTFINSKERLWLFVCCILECSASILRFVAQSSNLNLLLSLRLDWYSKCSVSDTADLSTSGVI
jgi:hypothetical protein